MQLQATIDADEHQALFTKVIYSLSTISDTVRFQFGQERVVLSSTNSTKTSLMSTTFNSQQFFEKFRLSSESKVDILVSSKQLALIFKNYRLSVEDVEFFRFTLNDSAHSNINRSRNKLLIEIVTKNNLKKNYSINYLNCKESDDLRIVKRYTEAVLTQTDDTEDSERIHYMMMETSILKNFLDMFPYSLEDFKIEVMKRSKKLNLIGLNKQQIVTGAKGSREAMALRQPMSLSISISLHDILGDNFLDIDGLNQTDNDSDKLSIMYRLRDFKTFVNLVNSVNLSGFYNRSSFEGQGQLPFLQNFLEIMLNRPGYPVLFSRRCELPNSYLTDQITNTVENKNEDFELFNIQLILLSDFEGDEVQIQDPNMNIPRVEIVNGDDNRVFVNNSKEPTPAHDSHHRINESQSTQNKAVRSRQRKFNLNPGAGANHSKQPGPDVDVNSTIEPGHAANRERPFLSVRWNDPRVIDQTGTNFVLNHTDQYGSGLANHAIDHLEGNRKRRLANDGDNDDYDNDNENDEQESQSNNDDALGPTQGIYKAKGLFD